MKIHLSKQDLTQCYRLYGTLELKHILIIVTFTLLFFGYLLLTNDNALILIPLGLLGGTAVFLIQRYPLVSYQASKIYKQQKGLEKEFELTISDSVLTITADNGHSSHAWSDFHKYKQNKHYLLLYLSDALFFMLPKRQISVDDLNAIDEYLNKVIKN